MASSRTLLGIAALAAALMIAGLGSTEEDLAQADVNDGGDGGNSDYEIRIESEATIAVGKKGLISLQLNPLPRRSISSDGPLKIAVSVAPAEGLTLDKRSLQRADATDPRATALRFAIGVDALKPSSYQIDFDIRFWVCGARTCRPVREHRKVSLKVAAPAGPAVPAEVGTSRATN